MSNAALKITENDVQGHPHLYLAQRNLAQVNAVLAHPLDKRGRITWLAAVLVTLQVLDGVLTYAGMSTFGMSAEGNPLLRGLMSIVGIIPAIALTKASCIAIIVTLCAQANRISWLPTALTCIAGIYTVAAVVPWSWILLIEYLA